jgi:hypothetical protein
VPADEAMTTRAIDHGVRFSFVAIVAICFPLHRMG